jgi:hypothetical protein
MKNAVFWDGSHVVRYTFTDVSEERTASIFRVEEEAEQITSKKQPAIRPMTPLTVKMEASLKHR